MIMKSSRLAKMTISSAVAMTVLNPLLFQSSSALTLTEFSANNLNSTVIVAANTPIKTGKFVTVKQEKATTGQAKIYVENGKRYLELDSEFSTANGPAVEVILHKNNQVPVNIVEKDYISLAKLKSFKGNQVYLIPDNVNLDDYESVAIWCRQFNVTFGFAELK